MASTVKDKLTEFHLCYIIIYIYIYSVQAELRGQFGPYDIQPFTQTPSTLMVIESNSREGMASCKQQSHLSIKTIATKNVSKWNS